MRVLLLLLAFSASAQAQADCEPGALLTDFFPEVNGVVSSRSAERDPNRVADRRRRALLRCPGLGLLFTGYADDTEPDPGALSLRRARAVAAPFVAEGFAADRLAAVGAGVHPNADSTRDRAGIMGNRRLRRVDVVSVALEDLPGWTPRAAGDPGPSEVVLEPGGARLWLDWDPAAGSACPGDEPLVLRAAFLDLRPLDTGCLRAARPVPRYTHHATAEVTHNSRRRPRTAVEAVDGVLGEGRRARPVGWLVGPTATAFTGGRFCERYSAALDAASRALHRRISDDGAEARAAVEQAAAEVLPFADAVEAVGGVVDGVALDCAPLLYDDAH